MATFEGYLFAKLHLIGSKSEGPKYILQRWDYSENPVIKKAELFEEDANLHKLLGHKVTIEGVFGPDGISYEKIAALSGDMVEPADVAVPHKLELELKPEHEVLWVDKMPPSPPSPQGMKITLRVKWPYRSIWHGICPTSQIYDFFIEKDGKTIWQWSKGQVFIMVITPVIVPGGDFVEYSVQWIFKPEEIQEEGEYLARAIFIASGQEVTKTFQVKFAVKK